MDIEDGYNGDSSGSSRESPVRDRPLEEASRGGYQVRLRLLGHHYRVLSMSLVSRLFR